MVNRWGLARLVLFSFPGLCEQLSALLTMLIFHPFSSLSQLLSSFWWSLPLFEGLTSEL